MQIRLKVFARSS